MPDNDVYNSVKILFIKTLVTI